MERATNGRGLFEAPVHDLEEGFALFAGEAQVEILHADEVFDVGRERGPGLRSAVGRDFDGGEADGQ